MATTSDYGVRIFPWQAGDDEPYVLLAKDTDEGVLFQVYDGNTHSLIDSVQTALADEHSLNVKQVNDVVYVVHPDSPPIKLVRDDGSTSGDYVFSQEEFEYDVSPILDKQVDSDYTFTVNAYTEGDNQYGLTLTIESDFFAAADTWRVGQTLVLCNDNSTRVYAGVLAYDENCEIDLEEYFDDELDEDEITVVQDDTGGLDFESQWMPASGKVTLTTQGVWGGILVLEEKNQKGDITELIRITVANGTTNETRSRDITSRGCNVRVRCIKRSKAVGTEYQVYGESMDKIRYVDYERDSGCYWKVTIAEEENTYFRIETISDGSCTALCQSSLGNGFSTDTYAEGAWNSKYGYPQTVGLFQERMVFAGNYKNPTTVWLSKTNDWGNFEEGTESTDPITATAIVDGRDKMLWLCVAKNNLILGTALREWYFGSNSTSVTPSGYSFISISNFGGTEGVNGIIFGGNLIAAKAGGEELRAINYNAITEETSGSDITLWAEHLFDGNAIKRVDTTIATKSRIWAVTQDGRLMCLTYDEENEVCAWTQNTVLDGVVDICVIRRDEVDVLILLVSKDGELLLGEIDPSSDVYTDDGEEYESLMETTALQLLDQGTHGRRVVFRGCDVYVTEGTDFYAKIGNCAWHRVNAGFGPDGTRNAFKNYKLTLDAEAKWEDEATLSIKTSYPAPLVVSAIGCSLNFT